LLACWLHTLASLASARKRAVRPENEYDYWCA
jgi:hypothetical protein